MADEGMAQAEAGDAAGAAKGGSKPPRAKRPDFTADARYAKLLTIFEVDSQAQLNDASKFRHADFQKKAAELKAMATGAAVAPGALKSWDIILQTLLEYAELASDTCSAEASRVATAAEAAASPDAEAPQGSGEAAEKAVEEEVENSEFAEEVEVAEQCVRQLLSGSELDPSAVSQFSEEDMIKAERTLALQLDAVETELRDQYDALLSNSSRTVADVVELLKVSLHLSHPPCTPFPLTSY